MGFGSTKRLPPNDVKWLQLQFKDPSNSAKTWNYKCKEDLNDENYHFGCHHKSHCIFSVLRRFYNLAGYQIDSKFVWKCSVIKY